MMKPKNETRVDCVADLIIFKIKGSMYVFMLKLFVKTTKAQCGPLVNFRLPLSKTLHIHFRFNELFNAQIHEQDTHETQSSTSILTLMDLYINVDFVTGFNIGFIAAG